ncbi:Protein FAM32A [Dirofilaria immitis]|nr:Protein FAM32A [Dirofilaria immitis]
MDDFFRSPHFIWWFLIPFALLINFMIWYDAYWFAQFGIPGKFLKFLGIHFPSFFIATNLFALIAHFGESLYSLKLSTAIKAVFTKESAPRKVSKQQSPLFSKRLSPARRRWFLLSPGGSGICGKIFSAFIRISHGVIHHEMDSNSNSNDNDPYKEVIRGGLKLKKGKSKFKKKWVLFKKESVDLKSIDITIHKDAEATVTYKTPAEIAFEKRQLQNQFERLAKKAAVSHREKVEKFNQQMSELTEFNDIPKVSWTK